MPKTYPIRQSFNAGEVGGLISFRDDLAKYNSACLTLENGVPLVEGGVKKMPGTYYAGPTALSGAGPSRIVPFQFSTAQGAVLELSAGIIRIWEASGVGVGSLGLALTLPAGSTDYNPATAYVATNIVLVGPFLAMAGSAGTLFIGAPYGTSVLPAITISVNTSDALSVTAVGTSPNQGINIALANTTPANNAASLIQAAIRSLGGLNSLVTNFIDLSQWIVVPDPIYFATPWITAPSLMLWQSSSSIVAATASNQFDQFPFVYVRVGVPHVIQLNTAYWAFDNFTSAPIELATPYLAQDLFSLDCSTQSADVLWIFHPNYPPAVVERLSANLWQYSLSLPGQQPNEPPYRGTPDVVKTGYSALGQNISLISQSTACIVLLATNSGPAPFADGSRIYINECSGMVELNEGEFLVSGLNYGAVSIPVTNSSGVVSTIPATGWYFTPQDPDTGQNVNSSSFLQYAGGGFAVQVVQMFGSAGNYPACGCLYQERLWVGGSDQNPTQLNGSVEDDYPDFIADPNEDDYACQFTLVSSQVNQLLNMVGTPNGLAIGTSGGVWIVSSSSGSSISQINVDAAQQSTYGVSSVQPQLVNGSAIFVSRSARIVTFLVFNFVTNQWENTDLTRLNRSITIGSSAETSGVAQTAFQMEPYPIFWAVRKDGQLLGLVFNTQDQVYAWFRINMTVEGGSIESVAVISGQNQEDQVVVVVNRTVNGATVRYVEYFMPQELFGQLSNAFFVHCGQQLQLSGPFNITGITNSNPAVVTAPGHNFTNGMQIQIQNVTGMTAVNSDQTINQDKTEAYTVSLSNPVAGTFSLLGMDTSNSLHPLRLNWTTYQSGGTVMQVTNQVTGMTYLIGNEVVATGDGAKILEPTLVTSDTVPFPYYCNLITIGIPYTVTIQPTNPVLSSQAATTRGMKQKLNQVTLSLYQAMGGKYGTDLNHMSPIIQGPGSMGQVPAMSSGEFNRDIDADWSNESTFYVQQCEPFPFTLRGLVWQDSTNPD